MHATNAHAHLEQKVLSTWVLQINLCQKVKVFILGLILNERCVL